MKKFCIKTGIKSGKDFSMKFSLSIKSKKLFIRHNALKHIEGEEN